MALLSFILVTILPIISFAEMQSTSYKIKGETINSTGGAGSSTNYKAYDGIGESFAEQGVTVNYELGVGADYPVIAQVPLQPSLTNPASYYDRLQFVIDSASNPSSTLFAIAITADSWATLQYIQANDTVSVSPVWQTYANWGGETGEIVLGLSASTTYCIKVQALNGDFSGTRWGPEACVATSEPTLTLDLSANATNFGSLSSNTINTSTPNIIATVSTNAQNGYVILTKDTGSGSNPGLNSIVASKLIPSLSTTLAEGAEGYGIQASSSSATVATTYNVSDSTVGGLQLSFQNLATKSGPGTNDAVVVTHKATVSTATKAGVDFQDIITYSAVASY